MLNLIVRGGMLVVQRKKSERATRGKRIGGSIAALVGIYLIYSGTQF